MYVCPVEEEMVLVNAAGIRPVDTVGSAEDGFEPTVLHHAHAQAHTHSATLHAHGRARERTDTHKLITLQEAVLRTIVDTFNSTYLGSQTLQPAVEQGAPDPPQPVKSGVYTPCDLRLLIKGETMQGHIKTSTKTVTLRGWTAGTVLTWQNAIARTTERSGCVKLGPWTHNLHGVV